MTIWRTVSWLAGSGRGAPGPRGRRRVAIRFRARLADPAGTPPRLPAGTSGGGRSCPVCALADVDGAMSVVSTP